MRRIADLLGPERLARLATPANLRLGREIAAAGDVQLTAVQPLSIEAKVGGTPASGLRRTVLLQSTDAGLSWSCTCTRHADLFCKHCVAAAIAATSGEVGR
jgi:uncharacterized Zn finger protein